MADQNQIWVLNPQQEVGQIPAEQQEAAEAQGYTTIPEENAQRLLMQQKHASDTALDLAAAASQKALETASLGTAPAAEIAMGMPQEQIQNLQEIAEAHPAISAAGTTAGILTDPFGAFSALGKGARAAQSAIGLTASKAAPAIYKIGDAATNLAIQGGVMASGDEFEKAVMGDPNQTAENALAHIGLSAALVGLLGAGAKGTSSLWEASGIGKKTNSFLKSVAAKYGHPDVTLSPEETSAATEEAPSPPIEGSVPGRPVLGPVAQASQAPEGSFEWNTYREMSAKDVPEVKKAAMEANAQVSEYALNQAGKTADDIDELKNFSQAEAGRQMGAKFVDEVVPVLDQAATDYREFTGKVASEQVAAPYLEKSALRENLKTLYEQEYSQNPNLAPARYLRNAINDVDNVSNISDFATQKVAHTPNYGSFGKAGEDPGMIHVKEQIRGELDKAYTDSIEHTRSFATSPEYLKKWESVKTQYGAAKELMKQIKSQIPVGGDGPDTFSKNLVDYIQREPEAFAKKMSDAHDATWLSVMRRQFPQTASEAQNYMRSVNLLGPALKIKGTQPGELLSTSKLLDTMAGLTPEVRNFLLTPAQQSEIGWAAKAIKSLNARMNPSGTAPTLMKFLRWLPGTVVGGISTLMGHNPITAAMYGALAQAVSGVPGSVKLSMLKFLGSDAPVSAGAFRGMARYITSASKGAGALQNSMKGIFTTGAAEAADAISNSLLTNEQMHKFEDRLSPMQNSAEALNQVDSSQIAHYMPEHNTALAAVYNRAAQYLNSIKPQPPRASPLDEGKISDEQHEAYRRQLSIMNDPGIVTSHVAAGTLQPQDLKTLSTVYPEYTKQLQNQVNMALIEHATKGEIVPHAARASASMLLGQPLDSTMMPQNIIAAQPMPKPGPQLPNTGTPKKSRFSAAQANKVNSMGFTPQQASQMRRSSF